FRTTHSCQARDFNWHNTIGFWSSLILIVITITATVISYKWAADLLTIVTGGKVRPALSEQNRQQQPSEIEISDESP
ncbi:PepSY domain-containing protein, partial [Vibrio alginolyticus]|uniref:PepSY domain-containing protein n=1 Tax=Vibrio alginolyticus TaxID=663 RepID=UPI001A8FA345